MQDENYPENSTLQVTVIFKYNLSMLQWYRVSLILWKLYLKSEYHRPSATCI